MAVISPAVDSVPGYGVMHNLMNKLEIKNLYKIFGKDGLRAYELIRNGVSLEEVRGCLDAFPAVVDASFDVKEGEIFVVMGLSGSGKSSLVNAGLKLTHLCRFEIDPPS